MWFATVIAAAGFVVASGAPQSRASGPDLSAVSLGFAPIVSGLPSSPVALARRTGDARLYVAERAGKVVIIDPTTHSVAGTVLSLSGVSTNGERGLLGLTFSNDGTKLYVDYTDMSGTINIVEYTMSGNIAQTSSARTLLAIPHSTFSNHNGGEVLIGPDNDLYIGVGDGGGGGDPNGNGQNVNVLLGKILRIDPTPSGSLPYTIPPDNPFVGMANHRAEIWMYGLRNPWRFSFDRQTGDVWIGDVGQNAYEEVDYASAGTSGQNFGWNLREGFHPYNGGAEPANGVDPLFEQAHTDGWCALIGGYVYRGSAIPNLNGAYVYADLCRTVLTGAVQSAGTVTQAQDFSVGLTNITAFGEDNDGELYVANLAGSIDELVLAPPPSVSVGSKAILEGDAGMRNLTFPVTLTQPATSTVTVQYNVTGVTATGGATHTPGVDFKLASGTVTFPVNSMTGKTPIARTISVPVFTDTTAEPDETFHVTLSSPTGGYGLANAVGTGTILNDDGVASGITLGVGDSSIMQQVSGAEAVSTPVALSAAAPGTTVTYTITPGTATHTGTARGGGEFGGPLSGSFRFSSMMKVHNITVSVWPDPSPDADHDFTITLTGVTGSGATIIRSTGTVTLLNP